MRQPMTLSERFYAHAEFDRANDGSCWRWRGNKNQAGYGQFRVGRHGRVWSAHRVSWMLKNGDIPPKMLVLHRCDNPGCCNPDHLFLGTAKDNMQDCLNKGRRATNYCKHTRIRKLTDDQVREIRADNRPVNVIAAAHGVSEQTVYGIRSRRRKALVPDATQTSP